MAKRNKKLFANRRSKMKLETLESRQLLATDLVGGEEVASDVTVNGNTFDQILMTDTSLSVKSDGDIARVAFLDLDGEIVEVEYAGAGTLHISLDQTGVADKAAHAPDAGIYDQPGVLYMQGHATVTIEQSDSDSQLNIYSIGPATDFVGGPEENPIFASLVDGGGDLPHSFGQADIQSVVIVNDPNGFGDLFGSITVGNVNFSGDSGVVGINAPNTDIIHDVRVGSLSATNTAQPTLQFGVSSSFGTLLMVGGDVQNTSINGALNTGPLDEGYEYDVNYADGVTAGFISGVNDDTDFLKSRIENGAFTGGTNPLLALTLEDATEYTIEPGTTQAELDSFFDGRTFINDVTVDGELDQFLSINAAGFRGSLTFNDDFSGSLVVSGNPEGDPVVDGGIGGDLVFLGDLIDAPSAEIDLAGGVAGKFSVTGDLGTDVKATSFGDIFIGGDLNAPISTDAKVANGTFDIDEGGIGNVSIGGDVKAQIEGITGIGNVTVDGDVNTGSFLRTSSSDSGDTALANIGTVDVAGDVLGGGTFIEIANNGTFDAVTILGGGGDDLDVGAFITAGILGNESDSTGAISITGAASVTLNGVDVDDGDAGGLTVEGGSADDDELTLDGTFNGVITATGFDDFDVNGDLTEASSFTGFGVADSSFDLDAGGSTAALTLTSFDDVSIGGTVGGDTTLTGIGIEGSDLDLDGDVEGDLIVSGFDDVDTDTGLTVEGDATITGTGVSTTDDASSASIDGTFEGGLTVSGFSDIDSDTTDVEGDASFAATGDTIADLDIDGTFSGSVSLSGATVIGLDAASDIGGDLTVTGSGDTFANIDLGGNVDGNTTVTEALDIDVESTSSFGGDVSLTTIDGTSDDSVSIDIAGGNAAFDTGTWTLDAGTADSEIEIGSGGVFSVDEFGGLVATAEDITVKADLNASKDAGNFTLTGDTALFGGFDLDGSAGTFTFNGDLDATGSIANSFTAEDGLGLFSVTGDVETGNTGDAFIEVNEGDFGGVDIDGDVTIEDNFIELDDGDSGLLDFDGDVEITDGGLFVGADAAITGLLVGDDVEASGSSFITAASLGDSTIDDELNLANDSRIELAGNLGNFTVGGEADIANDTAGAGALMFWDSGDLVFGALDTSGGSETAIVADDWIDEEQGADLDTIASITVNGQVKGDSGTIDVRASAIGDITIIGELADTDALVDDFNVLAAPNGNGSAANTSEDLLENDELEEIEQVDLDGSNLGDFSIGDILIQSVFPSLGPEADTSLFKDNNSFMALGAIGDITIDGAVGGSGNTQTRLFEESVDGVWFSVGDADGDLFDTDDELAENGFFGVEEDDTSEAAYTVAVATDPNYTDGTVTIGDVFVSALQSDTTTGVSGVNDISGDRAQAGGSIEGLAVLSGVVDSVGDGDLFEFDSDADEGPATENLLATDAAVIDADLDGTIDSVFIRSGVVKANLDLLADYTTALTVDPTADTGTETDDNAFISGIIAATSIDDLQSTGDELASGEGAIIGDLTAVDDGVIDGTDNTPGGGGALDDYNDIFVVVI